MAALVAHGVRRGRHRRFLEGKDLTPTEMTETNEAAQQQPEVTHTHEHTHDHDHDHAHQHAPSLNPELTREIEVEVGAD